MPSQTSGEVGSNCPRRTALFPFALIFNPVVSESILWTCGLAKVQGLIEDGRGFVCWLSGCLAHRSISPLRWPSSFSSINLLREVPQSLHFIAANVISRIGTTPILACFFSGLVVANIICSNSLCDIIISTCSTVPNIIYSDTLCGTKVWGLIEEGRGFVCSLSLAPRSISPLRWPLSFSSINLLREVAPNVISRVGTTPILACFFSGLVIANIIYSDASCAIITLPVLARLSCSFALPSAYCYTTCLAESFSLIWPVLSPFDAWLTCLCQIQMKSRHLPRSQREGFLSLTLIIR